MVEKNVVTIDSILVIPAGEEKIFENQFIHLEAGVKCEGTLIFKNCTIEPSLDLDGNKKNRTHTTSIRNDSILRTYCISIGINGKLEMDSCEIIHPGKDFMSGWTIMIKDTSFLLASPYDRIIDISGEAQFDGCSFIEEIASVPQALTENLISLCNADMKNCTFENVSGKVDVAAIVECSFTGCKDISCQDLINSTFTNCNAISVDGGAIRNCTLTHVASIFSTGDIDSCKFQKIEGAMEDEGIITIEDGTVTHCLFDDVELRNGAYLVEGVGNVIVEYCTFADCRTDREDLELCHGKVETGKLRKTWVEVDILDKDTCTGYDEVEKLD